MKKKPSRKRSKVMGIEQSLAMAVAMTAAVKVLVMSLKGFLNEETFKDLDDGLDIIGLATTQASQSRRLNTKLFKLRLDRYMSATRKSMARGQRRR